MTETFPDQDTEYMRLAIELAREAGRHGEVPVGALVVGPGGIVGRGFHDFPKQVHHARAGVARRPLTGPGGGLGG